MTPSEVRADDVGTAWLRAVHRVLHDCGGGTFHLAVRIGATDDDPALRRAVDDLVLAQGMQPVETVANTIFPARMASTTASLDQLVDRYRNLYPRLKKYGRNQRGTYFGRLVAFPTGGKYENQLGHSVEKLRNELKKSRRTSRYECAIYNPATDAGNAMGFPCLSSVAFHMDAKSDQLHLLANYRNQNLVERAYGNYLGLARLRNRIADEVGLEAGELLVVAGHASVDGRRRPLKSLIEQFGI
jgi:hypothetical protein